MTRPDSLAATPAGTGDRSADYAAHYEHAERDPIDYWAQVGKRLTWSKEFTRVKEVDFDTARFGIKWYADGELNAAVNCLDRHLPEHADRTALLFEADEPGKNYRITYRELHQQVCRLGNALRALGVVKGDRVTLYLPMIPQAAVAMLACARIGAVHSVVFGGFSPEALASRIHDCQSKVIITADEGVRGGKRVPLKKNTDVALNAHDLQCVQKVLVVQHTDAAIDMRKGRDVFYEDLIAAQSAVCEPERMNAEDPLFILYTSGSTGQPKGVLHTTGGYLAYASHTFDLLFRCERDDLFWCTADVGWVTGHTYVVYGPLSNGASVLMFEGVPHHPTHSRWWDIIDRHRVTIFYTAPTAIRALMREGEELVRRSSRASLRLLGTVGEPINPDVWRWFHRVVGDGRCPVIDTWWQTETGGALIAPLPGVTELKPGSATRPLPGIQVGLVDHEGRLLTGETEGNLVLLDSWPGQMRTVFGDQARFIQTYFTTFPGRYFTGDGARRDADGHYWITGRVDDVINVSGHRLGTAEIESALVAHPQVTEAAVVGCPHDIKGQAVYAYVTLQTGIEPSEALHNELQGCVRRDIGSIAVPEFIQWTPSLPKTRSGKIMRRILRKIAANEHDQLGDTSTLADPQVVYDLIEHRLNR